jgi:hypothetical protein
MINRVSHRYTTGTISLGMTSHCDIYDGQSQPHLYQFFACCMLWLLWKANNHSTALYWKHHYVLFNLLTPNNLYIRRAVSPLNSRTTYTGCHRRNGKNFGRVFLMLNYTDITQNTYIQSWTVTEIWPSKSLGFCGGPRTVRGLWRHILPLRMACNEIS